MTRRPQLTALLLVAALLVPGAAAADKEILFPTDACAKFACRELSKPELAMFGRVMSKLMASLPNTDSARYEQRGLKSAQGLGGIMVNEEMWEAADFPANVVDSLALPFGKSGVFPRAFALTYSYVLKDEGDRAKLGLGSSQHKVDDGEVDLFDLRVEVSAWSIPAPVEPGMNQAGKGSDIWERTLWGDEKGTVRTTVVVGPSARSRESPIGAPSEKLAPIKSVKVTFQGPTAEVRALARSLNRGALRALIGPVEKVIKAN